MEIKFLEIHFLIRYAFNERNQNIILEGILVVFWYQRRFLYIFQITMVVYSSSEETFSFDKLLQSISDSWSLSFLNLVFLLRLNLEIECGMHVWSIAMKLLDLLCKILFAETPLVSYISKFCFLWCSTIKLFRKMK